MKYGVMSSRFRPEIFVGRLNKKQTLFTEKEVATDLVLANVGEYVRDHFGGAMRATFPNLGFDLTVTVTPHVHRDDLPADLPDDPRADIASELGPAEADTFLGLLEQHGWTVTRKGER